MANVSKVLGNKLSFWNSDKSNTIPLSSSSFDDQNIESGIGKIHNTNLGKTSYIAVINVFKLVQNTHSKIEKIYVLLKYTTTTTKGKIPIPISMPISAEINNLYPKSFNSKKINPQIPDAMHEIN